MNLEFLHTAASTLPANAARVACVAGAVTVAEWIGVHHWNRQIFHSETPRRFLRALLWAGLITVFDTLVLSAFFILVPLRVQNAPPFWISAAALTLMFVWFEIYFYYYHRLLHWPVFYFMHRRHHSDVVTNPFSCCSFSIAERSLIFVGLLAPLALISPFYPVPILGVLLYLPLNLALNAWGHMNAELLPVWFPRSLPGRFFFTATYHGLHHARPYGHFGLFTRVIDRLHGTEFADYEAFHGGRI